MGGRMVEAGGYAEKMDVVERKTMRLIEDWK
jgi:hypothetical protein